MTQQQSRMCGGMVVVMGLATLFCLGRGFSLAAQLCAFGIVVFVLLPSVFLVKRDGER